jgi:hypothetical protein
LGGPGPAPRRTRLLLWTVAALALILGASALSPGTLAQDLRITSRADRTRLRIGENLTYTLVIAGAGAALPQPTLPPLSGFKGVGQYMTPEPGGSGLAYHYLLTPLQSGRLEVPDFDLRIAGQTYTVKGFTAEVETNGEAPTRAPLETADAPPAALGGKDVLLVGSLSAPRVYQGQPVVYALHLFTLRAIRGIDVSPEYPGFQRVEDPKATQTPIHQTTHDGRLYLDAVVRRAALFPLQPGRVTIGPFSADLRVEPPGSGSPVRATVTGGQVALEVLPLPSSPPGFKGAVGSFNLVTVTPPPLRADTGQPFTLAVRVEGSGFLPEDPLETSSTPFFATYPATSEDASAFDGAQYKTLRTIRVPVLPKVASDAVLPPLKLVYFDPADRAYKTLEAGGGKVLVSGQGTSAQPEVAIAPLIRQPRAGRPPGTPLPDGTFWALVLLPFLANASLAIGLWAYRNLFIAPEKKRVRQLARQARKALAQAHRNLDVRRADLFHDALSRALSAGLDLRTGRTTGGLSRDQLAVALSEAGLGPEAVAILLDLREDLESARYAPERPTRQDLQLRYDAVAKFAKEATHE